MIFLRFINSAVTRILIVFSIAQLLYACSSPETNSSILLESRSVSWSAPDLREGNTSLPIEEISSYRVYYGTTTGVYQNEIEIQSDGSSNGVATINGLTPGVTYYFVVTAFDTNGVESMYSPENELFIPL